MSLQTDKRNAMGTFHRELSHGIASLPASETLPVGFCSGCEGEDNQCQHMLYTELPHAPCSHKPTCFLAKKTEVSPPSCHSQCSPTCCAETDKPPWHCVPVEPTCSAATVPAPSAQGSGWTHLYWWFQQPRAWNLPSLLKTWLCRRKSLLRCKTLLHSSKAPAAPVASAQDILVYSGPTSKAQQVGTDSVRLDFNNQVKHFPCPWSSCGKARCFELG